MIIGLAFIEALTIYAFVISLMMLGKIPATEKMLELAEKMIR
jgi:hypothetical protein